jgi:hypothetical protein
MTALVLALALTTAFLAAAQPGHAGHIHVSPACQVNQDPQGGCVG